MRRLIKWIIIIVVILGLAGGVHWYLISTYEIKTVYVDGNVHYSDEQIEDIVLTGRFGRNSLYISHKYKNREVEDVPFVQTMDVQIVSPDTIRISVYEKALAGYVEYLGRYVYFDKDGIAVEISNVKTFGIPQVLGVNFDYVILHEPLPVENKNLFTSVLNITQLMTKYSVNADRLYIKDNDEVTLYVNDIEVCLGKQENLDVKIMNLPSILSNIVDQKGVLHMESYDDLNGNATFEPAQR